MFNHVQGSGKDLPGTESTSPARREQKPGLSVMQGCRTDGQLPESTRPPARHLPRSHRTWPPHPHPRASLSPRPEPPHVGLGPRAG